MSFLNLSFYKFTHLEAPDSAQKWLQNFLKSTEIRGTILLAHEGINASLAGPEQHMRSLQELFALDSRFQNLPYKESRSATQPFTRMFVKIKKEIVTMGVPEVNPALKSAPNMEPQELKRWLDEKRCFLLIDTRNDYEVKLGTFEGAADFCIESFRDFPAKVRSLSAAEKQLPVVTFCTGGILCEKAAPLMLELGFADVYQLNGGILNYFKECGGTHWNGECFVFDDRVAVNPELEVTGASICAVCQYPVPKNKTKCTNCVETNYPHE